MGHFSNQKQLQQDDSTDEDGTIDKEQQQRRQKQLKDNDEIYESVANLIYVY